MEEMNTQCLQLKCSIWAQKKIISESVTNRNMQNVQQKEPIKCTQVTEQLDPLCHICYLNKLTNVFLTGACGAGDWKEGCLIKEMQSPVLPVTSDQTTGPAIIRSESRRKANGGQQKQQPQTSEGSRQQYQFFTITATFSSLPVSHLLT